MEWKATNGLIQWEYRLGPAGANECGSLDESRGKEQP
jgi:hypothetical protein